MPCLATRTAAGLHAAPLVPAFMGPFFRRFLQRLTVGTDEAKAVTCMSISTGAQVSGDTLSSAGLVEATQVALAIMTPFAGFRVEPSRMSRKRGGNATGSVDGPRAATAPQTSG